MRLRIRGAFAIILAVAAASSTTPTVAAFIVNTGTTSSATHTTHTHLRLQQQQRSSDDNTSNDNNNDNASTTNNSRREMFQQISSRAAAAAALLLLPTTANPQTSNAACLTGDASFDCIGNYKVPLDDAIRSYVDTPETLAKFAPDLKWVPPVEYPKSYQLAKEEVMGLKTNLQALTPLVSKGDLTAAGIEVLKIIPRVTVAGRVVIGTLQEKKEMSMRALRVEAAHNDLLAALGSVDVLIGQGLKGELGSLTVGQIHVIQELSEMNLYYTELVRAIPEDFSG